VYDFQDKEMMERFRPSLGNTNTMLCCVMGCYVMLCNVIKWYSMCYVILCSILLCYVRYANYFISRIEYFTICKYMHKYMDTHLTHTHIHTVYNLLEQNTHARKRTYTHLMYTYTHLTHTYTHLTYTYTHLTYTYLHHTHCTHRGSHASQASERCP
jgi:hypothetical protein